MARTVAAPGYDFVAALSSPSAAESVANLTPQRPASDTTLALPRLIVVASARPEIVANGVPTSIPSAVRAPGRVTKIFRSVSLENVRATVSFPIPRTAIIASLSRPARALTTYTNDITGRRHSPTRNGPTAPCLMIAWSSTMICPSLDASSGSSGWARVDEDGVAGLCRGLSLPPQPASISIAPVITSETGRFIPVGEIRRVPSVHARHRTGAHNWTPPRRPAG